MTKPYRSPGRKAYKMRVRHPDGRAQVCGCDTENAATARAMARWLDSLYNDRTPLALSALDAIVSKRVTLPRCYDNRHDLTPFLAKIEDTDVSPMVEQWHTEKQKSRKGAGSADKYREQVRALVIEGEPFPASRFTFREILKHLRSLSVQDPTRNRHKAAFSSFAQWLVAEGVIEGNPVREIQGWSEGDGRLVYYERDQAKALIETLPQPYAAIDALMVSAGLEWQAIERLRARDVDLTALTVQAHGGKTRWRNRLCRIVEPWCVEYIRPALVGKLPDALVFEGVREWWALREHKAAAERKGLPLSTLHDWRHTHAVLMLRSGYKPTVVAHQLGHRDTSLVWKRYGRFVIDQRDYVIDSAPAIVPDVKENVR
jgi:integrase